MSRYTDVDHRNRVLPHVGAYWSVELVSLEEALKPVEESINEPDRSVETAKKHCNFPSEHGLTLDESAALYLYTMESDKNSFYKVLNEVLRSDNRPAIKPWFPFLKLFDIALSKLPTVKENIWRGVSGDISKQFKKDEILTWWSISSCTKSLDVIEEFLGSDANSTLFMIESVNGKDVSKYTAFPNENEVIMGVGTELRVKSNTLNHHGGLNVVHLVELSDDDDVKQLSDTAGTMNFKQQMPITGVDSTQELMMVYAPASLQHTGYLESSSEPEELELMATLHSAPSGRSYRFARGNSKVSSHHIMPACPLCGLNDQVRTYWGSETIAFRRHHLSDFLSLRICRDYAIARHNPAGYIGEHTGFFFFVPVGSSKMHICDYRH